MDKTELLAKLKPEIDIVDQAMQSDLQGLSARNLLPDSLVEVLEHALFNGGKRIRPLLCILTAGLCGSDSKEIYRLAIAFALNADMLGLQASDLNLVTAILVAIALILPGAGNPIKDLLARRRAR